MLHDEYLPTYNLPNVKLVDTQGEGVNELTPNGILVGGSQYDLDLIILGTGYNLSDHTSPASRASLACIGRGGKSMDQKWLEGVATLHGVISRDFPNLFLSGPYQIGVTANLMYSLDRIAEHVAYIVSESVKRAGNNQKVVVEPTTGGEEEWTKEILTRSIAFAAFSGCTPGYLNGEGRQIHGEIEQMKAARNSTWGEGVSSYVKQLEAWRATGELNGLEIKYF